MKRTTQPLVIANWKMNPETLTGAKALFSGIKTQAEKHRTRAVIAPPFVYLGPLAELRTGRYLSLAAQHVHAARSGTFTGEVSAPMLRSMKVTHVIVGHSERRSAGESDEDIAKQVHAVHRAGMTPVLCVGERERDTSGKYLGVVESQLRTGLQEMAKKDIPAVVIAYEPIWAVSTGDGQGDAAMPAYAHEMRLFVQKVLADTYTRKLAERTTTIYGGSVNPANAESLLEEGVVDGFLVGGASLSAKEFGGILKAVHDHR